jgi:hypothetical protein
MEKITFDNLIGPNGKTLELDLPDELDTPEAAQKREAIREKAMLAGKRLKKIFNRINMKLDQLEQKHIEARSKAAGVI